MNVWNRLGDLGKGTLDWVGDVGLAITSPVKFAWDIASAPWNDRKEFNGLANTLQQASTDFGKNLARPLGGAVSAAMHINENLIRQPLSAAMLYTQDPSQGFDKAWNARSKISLGQSTMGLVGKVLSPLPDSITPDFADNNFNIYDKTQRDRAFSNSIYGRVTSGSIDFAAQLFGDVTLVGGKAYKVYKVADTVEKTLFGLRAARAGEINNYSKAAENFATNDAAYAMNHPYVKASNDPATSAYLLGQTATKDEALNVMSALHGDASGVDDLLLLKRPDLADPLRASMTVADRSAVRIILAEEEKLNKTWTADMLPFDRRTSEEILADKEYLNAWAAHDKFAGIFETITEPGAMLAPSGLSKGMQPVGNFLAQARSVPYHSLKVGTAKQEFYQPTVWHKLYNKISWAEGERASGVVNLNDGASIQEITAVANRLVALTKSGNIVTKFLTPKSSFSNDDALQFIDSYAAAVTPEARLTVAHQLEETGYRVIAAKHGIDTDTAKILFDTHVSKRSNKLNELKESGFLWDADTASMLKIPFFESQNANFLPMADFDTVHRVLKANSIKFGRLSGALFGSAEMLDSASDIWKASVLLRLGYPIRNTMDSQARMLATVGGMAVMKNIVSGVKHGLQNIASGQSTNRIVDRFTRIGKPDPTIALDRLKVLGSQIADHKITITKLEEALKKQPNDFSIVGKIADELELIRVKNAVYESDNRAYSKIESARTGVGTQKKTVGQGNVTLKSRYETADGVKYETDGALGSADAPLMRILNSSSRSFQSYLSDVTTIHGGAVATRGIGAVRPDDVNYYQAWSDSIKNFTNSDVARSIMRGESPQNIAIKLADDSKLRKSLGLSRDEALDYVYRAKSFTDNYIPDGYGIREKILSDSRDAIVTPEFLRNAIRDPSKLPIVHGALVEENINMKSRQVTRGIINEVFKFLGSVPEDTWARHPLFVNLYNASIQKRFNAAEFLNKKRFTPEEFTKLEYGLRKAARADALKGVKGTLYNVERRTNAAHLFKFISPFFSAQENAIKTWLKISTNNPVVISRAAEIWTAPNRLGIATDQKGDKVPVGKALSANDTMWFELPKGIAKIAGIGGLDSLNQVGISKRSLDVIFQGNPMGISVGPLASVPASYIMKKIPKMADVLAFAFPYGPDTSVTQLMPTYLRRVFERAQGVNNSNYAQAYQLIWLTEQHKARDEGRPYLTEAQIDAKTKAYYSMRITASLVLPFAPQFKSPYRFYMDQWRKYSDKYGMEADSKFLEDYPDFFDFATSMSKNSTGIAPTMSAVQNAKNYKGLIAEVVKDNPSLVGLITNGTGGANYSPTASWWQSETQVTAGAPDKFRDTGTPLENIAKNEARKGWAEYRKMTTILEDQLRKRGLTSVDDNGAEDLKATKDSIIARLATEVDPVTGKSTGKPSAWYNDYRDVDGAKTARTVSGLRTIVNDETFLKKNSKDPTWKSVVAYLQLRDQIASSLANRSSKSITAKDNADLKYKLDYYVGQLKTDDVNFADIYDRFLSQDMIYDKNLGLGA